MSWERVHPAGVMLLLLFLAAKCRTEFTMSIVALAGEFGLYAVDPGPKGRKSSARG